MATPISVTTKETLKCNKSKNGQIIIALKKDLGFVNHTLRGILVPIYQRFANIDAHYLYPKFIYKKANHKNGRPLFIVYVSRPSISIHKM